MRVLLTGSNGQLGQQLIASTPKLINNSSVELIASNRINLDLANSNA